MPRPQQHLSRLVAQSLLYRQKPLGGPRCCPNSFRVPPVQRVASRAFATTPIRNDREPLSPQTSTAESTIPPAQPHLEHAANPKPKRRRRGYVYAAIFLLIGTSIGSLFRMSLSPPPLPEPGTKEDEYIVASIHEKGEKLSLVQKLSSDPAWESWYAYEGRKIVDRPPSITSGPMSGCRGLAYQRIFRNKTTGEVTSVVYFGGGLSGFPGVVHGGALATVLDESMGRCAIYRFPARTGVTANLDLTYKKPTLTNAFYVVKTWPVVAESDEVVAKDGTKKSDRKLWIHGRIETEQGKVCVEAKALFVVPRGAKIGPLIEKW